MKIKKLAFIFLALCIITWFLSRAYGTQILQITIATNKPSYELGENVQIQGNLTLDGAPVSNGLAAIQIDNPKNVPVIIRTLPTGTEPPQDWKIELVEVVPCDSQGNPKSSFQRGTMAYFKTTIRSTDTMTRNVAISLNLYYASNMLSFKAFFPLMDYEIRPGETKSPILGVPIPSGAQIGNAIVYAGIFTNRPRDGGTAYSPEKSAPFSITSTATATYTSETINPTSTEGSFNLNFKLPNTDGVLGNYTIYSNAIYKGDDAYPLVARTNCTFEVTLTGDINNDGIVDYLDLNIIARAYGSVPEDPRWDSRADLNGDSVIDYVDVNMCARNFGKSGTY